jgi:hypothetical protein
MMDMIVRMLRDVKVDKKEKDLFYFSRHHWMIRASRKMPREVGKGKKNLFFWVLGMLGNDGGVKNGVKVHQRHQKGHPRTLERKYIYIYIYIFLEHQTRATKKDAMGIENDAKKLLEKKILFWAREGNKEDTMQCSWAHYQ